MLVDDDSSTGPLQPPLQRAAARVASLVKAHVDEVLAAGCACEGPASGLTSMLRRTLSALSPVLHSLRSQWAQAWSPAIRKHLCDPAAADDDEESGPGADRKLLQQQQQLRPAELSNGGGAVVVGGLVQVVTAAVDAFVATETGRRCADALQQQLEGSGFGDIRSAIDSIHGSIKGDALVEAVRALANGLDAIISSDSIIGSTVLNAVAELPGEAIVRDTLLALGALVRSTADAAPFLGWVQTAETAPFQELADSLARLQGEWKRLSALSAAGCGGIRSGSSGTTDDAVRTVAGADGTGGSLATSPSSAGRRRQMQATGVVTSMSAPIFVSGFDVRLVGGSSSSSAASGRLEVLHNGAWGTVCADNFGAEEATVACRHLGYSRGTAYTAGGGSGIIWLDNVDCNPLDHAVLDQCDFSGDWGLTGCTHAQDVGVNCTVSTGDLRVTESLQPHYGRIEVFFEGAWMRFCSWGVPEFSSVEAGAACRQLGFADGAAYSHGSSTAGCITLDGACRQAILQGQTATLSSCDMSVRSGGYNAWGSVVYNAESGVRCTVDPPSEGAVRLADGYVYNQGAVEMFHNGSWGSFCIGGEGGSVYANGRVVCRQLGYADVVYTTTAWRQTSGPILSDKLACNSSLHLRLDQCPNVVTPSASLSCGHASDLQVYCDVYEGSVRLANGTLPTEGRLEVHRRGAWHSVCNESFTNAEATAACWQLGNYGYRGEVYTHGGGTGKHIMTGFNCSQSEWGFGYFSRLYNCLSWQSWNDFESPINRANCSHAQDVGIRCIPAWAGQAPVRLMGGYSPSSGRLEVLQNDTWGSVCGRTTFTIYEASAVCIQLGYSVGYPYIAGGGSGPIREYVTCSGSTILLEFLTANCLYSNGAIQQQGCSHDQDVGVICVGYDSPPVEDTPSGALLQRTLPYTLRESKVAALESALRAIQLFPYVENWAVRRWESGLLPQLMDAQLGDGIVRDIVQPVLSKLLSTTAGSIIIDAFMAKATGGVKMALSALLGTYQVVPREWANTQTLNTLLDALADVTDPKVEDSRLSMAGLANDTVAVMHTLLRSAAESIASETGGLRQALWISPAERNKLVLFLNSVDEALNMTEPFLWLPGSVLFDYIDTKDDSRMQRLWARTAVSAVRVAGHIGGLVGWLGRAWEASAGPLLDSVLMCSQASAASRQLVRETLGPLVASFRDRLVRPFLSTTGFGRAVASALEAMGVPRKIGSDVLQYLINGLWSQEPELFLSQTAKELAAAVESAAFDIPPREVIRDSLVFIGWAVKVIHDMTSTGELGLAFRAMHGSYETYEDNIRMLSFWSRMSELISNFEAVYNMPGYTFNAAADFQGQPGSGADPIPNPSSPTSNESAPSQGQSPIAIPNLGPTPPECLTCQACLRITAPLAVFLLSNASVSDKIAQAERVANSLGEALTGPNKLLVSSYISSNLRRAIYGSSGGLALVTAARAGYLCGLAGLCGAGITCEGLSATRMGGSEATLSGKLDWCTVEGVAGGSLAYQPPPGSCRLDSECPANSQCSVPTSSVSTNGPWMFSRCYATGSCDKYCELSSTGMLLEQLNAGVVTCSADSECATGEFCAAAPCNIWQCDTGSQKLVQSACQGMCRPLSPQVLSAELNYDGNQIILVLNTPAAPFSRVPCGRIFDSATLQRLGGSSSALCTSTPDAMLVVSLGPGATLAVGDVLQLLASGSALVSRFDTSRAFTGSVKVLPCESCDTPQPSISGPTTISQPCDRSRNVLSPAGALPVEFDASASIRSAGRTVRVVNVTWAVQSAPFSSRATLQAAVDRTNALTSTMDRLLLSLTPSEVSALEIGSEYRLGITLESWFGTSAPSSITFSKASAATKPVVKISGPAIQIFYIRTGLRASAVASIACAGRKLRWTWVGRDAASASVLGGSIITSQNLYIKGPIPSIVHDQQLQFTVSATYDDDLTGVAPATADITFTAIGSDPVARLTGPSGDWPDNYTLVFNATASFDPDAAAGSISSSTSLTFTWSCIRADGSSTPCFTGAQRGDTTTTAGVWTIPAGLLASDTWYTIRVTVRKPSVLGAVMPSDTAFIRFRPRSAAKPFPRGTLSRVCSLAAGCAALYSTDQPLIVSLMLDDASRFATVTWSSDTIPLLNDSTTAQQQQQQQDTAAGGISRTLTIPAGLFRQLPTSVITIAITATMDLDGMQGLATLVVELNSAPYCGRNASSPSQCLRLDVRNDTAPYATVVARAIGWVDDLDESLRYEFGVRGMNASSPDQARARGSASSTTLVGMRAGLWTVYVCASDAQGARSCADGTVKINDPPASFDAKAALASLDVAAVAASNDLDALRDLASQISVVISAMTISSSNASDTSLQEQVVAQQTTAIANALLNSLTNVQDPEQVLQTMMALAAVAQTAAAVLPDSTRGIYLTAAQLAATAFLDSTSSASTAELLSSLSDICRLLGTAMPRGKGSTTGNGAGRRRRLLADATTTAARTSLADLVTLDSKLGDALGQTATPGADYIASGDNGVYVSAAVVPTTASTSGSVTLTLRSGPTAATTTAAGGLDTEAQLVLSGQAATDASGYSVVLQYAPSASTAVAQATAGLLVAPKTTLGGLTTISWKPPSTSSGTGAAALGGSSYVLLAIPAPPGFNAASEITSCLLYDAAAAADMVTLSEESGSFVGYNATSGLVKCRVSKLGSYIVAQTPGPSATTRVFLITLLFRVDSADKLATQVQHDAFRSGLLVALADIYSVPVTSITLSSVSGVRTDNTIQVYVQLMVPASRPEDGGAAAGFEANPKSKLPASFVAAFGITDVKIQRGQQNNAVVPPANDDDGDKRGLSGGAIAGIVVGSIVAAMLVALLVILTVRRHYKARVLARSSASTTTTDPQQEVRTTAIGNVSEQQGNDPPAPPV